MGGQVYGAKRLKNFFGVPPIFSFCPPVVGAQGSTTEVMAPTIAAREGLVVIMYIYAQVVVHNTSGFFAQSEVAGL